MAKTISRDLYFRLWALAFAVGAAGGSISGLIITQYPDDPTAKLIATVFACVGLISTVGLAQSKPAVSPRKNDEAGGGPQGPTVET